MSSYGIYNLVRALAKPYVGAHFLYKGKKIKVWKAAEIKKNSLTNCEPGKVLKVFENGSLLIKAYDNCVKVLEFEPKVRIKTGECL
jgi:methionyl-tRNA formyltransferase